MGPAPGAAANRNDPCPCGSGKKYKKCCMTRATPASSPDLRAMVRKGLDLQRAGRLMEAAAHLRGVLDRFPDDPDALFALGQVEGQAGRLDEAETLIRRAIAAAPDRPHFHARLAGLLLDAGRSAAALESAGRALALDAGIVLAHRTMARCYERTSRLDDAAASASAALALAPGDAASTIVLARVRRRQGRSEEARADLETLLAEGPPPDLRVRAMHELGLALESLGAYDDAFALFARCGAEEAAGPRAAAIERTTWSTVIRQYHEGMTDELARRFEDAGFDDRLPAPSFLVGFPRSGTTMTEQVMAAHPALVTADETKLIRRVKVALGRMSKGLDDITVMLDRLDRDQVAALRAVYWREAEATLGEALAGKRLIDKLPLNIVHLGLINVLFPEARVIVALRDPRDVCLSCLVQDFQLNDAMIHFLTLEDTARFYAEVMGLWLRDRERLSLDVLEVRYEDTVLDLETQARRILEFLDVGWDASVLDFHEKARDRLISTPSYASVVEKVHTRAIGRWRRYETHLRPVLARLQPFVEAFGYE